MIKDNRIEKLYNSGKINKSIFIVILSIILFKFLTYEHYPETDEIASINLLSSVKTSFLKFSGHNHFLSTQLGNLIIYIFGVDIMKIRLLSLTYFFSMLFLVQVYLRDYTKTFIFIFIYLSVDVITGYFSLYRGYAISSLLFVFIFVLIDYKKNNLQNSKLLYFILALLLIHNETTILLVAPILIAFNFQYFKYKDKFQIRSYKNFILFFLLPFFSLYLIFCFTEGVLQRKIFITASNFKDIAPLIFNNFFSIIYDGFSKLTVNYSTNSKFFYNLSEFYTYIEKDPYLFSIFGISLLKSIYFIFFKKNKDIIHLIILIFFISFLLINRNGPTRIYTGFISFFIFYIIRDFHLDFFKTKTINPKTIFNTILILVIFTKLYNIDFIKVDDRKEYKIYKKEYIYFKKNLTNCNFPSKIHKEEFNKHLEYFVYLQECKKKPNINKFYKYYKS